MSDWKTVVRFPAPPPVTRTLASGGFEADFYGDLKSDPPLYHFIVTRKGATEILAMGQEHSMQDAERAALEAMHDLYKRGLDQSTG